MRALAVLTLVACTASAPASQTPATPRDVAVSARATVESWRQAWEVRSVEALEKLYAHDLDVVLITEGQPLTGWSSIDATLKDKLARATTVRVTLKDVQVRAQGENVATAVATMRREITDGATTTTENGTLSLVLRRDNDVWLITVEHYSYRRPS